MIKIDLEKFYVPNTKSQVSILPFYKLSKTGHPKQELTFYEHQYQLPYFFTCLAYNLISKKGWNFSVRWYRKGRKCTPHSFPAFF